MKKHMAELQRGESMETRQKFSKGEESDSPTNIEQGLMEQRNESFCTERLATGILPSAPTTKQRSVQKTLSYPDCSVLDTKIKRNCNNVMGVAL